MATALPNYSTIAYDRFLGSLTGFKEAAKGINYTSAWMQTASSRFEGTVVAKTGRAASNAKNAVSAFVDVPKGIIDLGHKVEVYRAAKTDEKRSEARNDVVMQGLELGGPIDDTTKLIDGNILPLGTRIVNIVGRINFIALFIASAWKATKELANISAGRVAKIELTGDKKSEAVQLALLNLAKHVSYAVLAVTGFMLIQAVPYIAPWMPLAGATSALVFGILSHFYERSHGLDKYKTA